MIAETIIHELKRRHGELNFNGLIDHMKHSEIVFHDKELNGPIGLASLDCIYLNNQLHIRLQI